MKAYYIPDGIYNMIQSLFPAIYTNIDSIDQYYIEVKDTNGDIIATSPTLYVGNCCDDKVRIHFLNYSGAMDAINLKKILDEHETTSSVMQKPIASPFNRADHAVNRFDVRSNDTISLWTRSYAEKDRKWLNELFDSPFALMEFIDPMNSKSYIPVTILDGKMENMKVEDRYIYEINLQIKPSHERFIIRN